MSEAKRTLGLLLAIPRAIVTPDLYSTFVLLALLVDGHGRLKGEGRNAKALLVEAIMIVVLLWLNVRVRVITGRAKRI